ncbi:MAG: hypothetical protein AAF703_14020 [Cyanobacteria bacterium P01_D01_bin.105]
MTLRFSHLLPRFLLAATVAASFACTSQLREYTQLTMQAKSLANGTDVTPESLEAVEDILGKRLDGLGIALVEIETAEPDKIVVRLPQTVNVQAAQSVLTNTGQLYLRNQKPDTQADLANNIEELQRLLVEQNTLVQQAKVAEAEALQVAVNQARADIVVLFEPSELTGEMLHDARARPSDTAPGTWDVNIQFSEEGAALFAAQTKLMAGTGRAVGLFLDDVLLSTPVVDVGYAQTGITGGTAVISGNFTAVAAEELEVQLKSGALPVALETLAVTSSSDEAAASDDDGSDS